MDNIFRGVRKLISLQGVGIVKSSSCFLISWPSVTVAVLMSSTFLQGCLEIIIEERICSCRK